MPAIHIGTWEVLPSGGSTIALDDDRIAVAGPAHLVVWRHGRRLQTVESPWPAPGHPRFLGSRVLWGPGVLDLDTGIYSPMENARPAAWPGGGERPHLHAWSVRGDRLLISSSTGDRSRPTRVALFDGGTGRLLSTLWHGSDLPPEAAWVGQQSVVVGFRDPRVFDPTSGIERGRVALGGSTIARIDADDDEGRIVAVDVNRSIAWIDPEAWLVLDRWEGRWQDAAIAPDGRFVAALDFAGTLHFASLEDGRFRPIGDISEAAALPYASSVEIARGAIGLAGGGGAARATLAVDLRDG